VSGNKKKGKVMPSSIQQNHHKQPPPIVLAVRHAESVWNVLYREHCSNQDKDETDEDGGGDPTATANNKRYAHPLMFQPDCSITERGKLQCQQAGQELQKILEEYLRKDKNSAPNNTMDESSSSSMTGGTTTADTTTTATTTIVPHMTFIVSPLRRALQTARLMLQHCQYQPSSITICKECAEVMVDACDIGSPIHVLQDEFPEYNFDTLRFTSQSLQVSSLHDAEQHISFTSHNSDNPKSTCTNHTQNWWPHGFPVEQQWEKMRNGEPDGKETTDMVWTRLLQLKEFILKQQQQHHINIVVVVCHSEIIEWLTRPTPVQEGIWIDNCQILDITKYILL
jgi:broad specificity phosphatase PhoE